MEYSPTTETTPVERELVSDKELAVLSCDRNTILTESDIPANEIILDLLLARKLRHYRNYTFNNVRLLGFLDVISMNLLLLFGDKRIFEE